MFGRNVLDSRRCVGASSSAAACCNLAYVSTVTPSVEDLTRTAGVVYTPDWLAAFVVDRVIDCGTALQEACCLDPACGDGAFLVEIVRRLADCVPMDELPHVVEGSVFGTDIDDAACDIARARVVAAVEGVSGPQPKRFFADNVRCEDFLEADRDERFDVVIGNPPFVSARNLSARQKVRFLERFETAWGRLDLYALFLEHALRHLREGGRLGFITPDKWLTAQSAGPLRTFVAHGFTVRSFDRFDRHDLFPGVATVPCVTVIDREQGPSANAICRWWDVDGYNAVPIAGGIEEIAVAGDGSPWESAPPTTISPAPRSQSIPLRHIVERISAGLATGLNACFLLNADQAREVEPELLRPVARGRDVQVGRVADSSRWMLLPYRFDADGDTAELVDLADFPRARAHLERHREQLQQRHCVRVWGKTWYDLHDPVTFDLARRPKLLLPDVAFEPRFAADRGEFLPVHSAYYLILRSDAEFDEEELASLLNSPSVIADLRRRAPTAKSGYRRFRTAVLRDTPVPLDAG